MNIRQISRLMLVGLMVLAISVGVIAQPKSKGAYRGKHHKAGVMKQLDLTEAQKTAIQSIHEQSKAEAQRIKQSNLTQEQKRSQFMELRQRTHGQVMNVLTPAQREQMNTMKQQRPDRGMNCAAKLNLSNEQKARAQEIRTTTQQRVGNVRSDQTLTDAEKRDRIASVKRAAHREFMSILTPAQQNELANCSKGKKMSQGRTR